MIRSKRSLRARATPDRKNPERKKSERRRSGAAVLGELRIGHGLDVHRLVNGRPLILGGVRIPHRLGLDGHSDADALIHAVIDALLGAAGRPDIGSLFPNTDKRWKDRDSRELLRIAWRQLRREGWLLINLDSTVLAQAPRLSPFFSAMKAELAAILGVALSCIGIKATTTEKAGFVGRQEGLVASAVVLLRRAR